MLASRGDMAPANAGEFSSYMQSVQAGEFRGQRLRLKASLASQAADSGFIWMRVDDGHNNILRFDNMAKRPEPAHTIHYGFLLKGRGPLWAKNFRLDLIGPEVKPTKRNGKVLTKPENLDFTFA